MHQAPRCLKLSTAFGEIVQALGRAILAGCKRSTQLARAYTLRMVKRLSMEHPGITLYQHVDDMTNLVRPRSAASLAEEAVQYIRDFASEAARLHMAISEKSVILPDNEHTRRVCRIANREGI